MKKIQSLNGLWEYRVGKGEFSPKNVPFSELPVGHSECKRSFDLDFTSEKIFLKFDGITYEAKVFLNNTFLGEMLPYCEYSFDITDCVTEKNNFLLVELEDISPKFGPTAGWENYGGIIRNVTIEYKKENYIKDVFAYSKLSQNYTCADFVVKTDCVVLEKASFKIELFYNEKSVICYTQPTNEFIHHSICDINLWSPDKPEIYRLDVTLFSKGEEVDFYSCNIGFREIVCDKHKFIINGKPLFLKGVCKHEMYGDSGHCPSEAQMEEDMQRIKETGCNFVRLVHYPHNKKILDIADKIGLFVSEEPGLWWSDTSDPKVSAGSLEVLKRTILRDRNHPSIAFWLCFNECKFTEEFLINSKKVCLEYDHTRLVSGANCMSNEDTLKYYNICGFDFYTMHPYSNTFERANESAKILNDKPLLFTEWGGFDVYDNPRLLSSYMAKMNELYMNASDDGALAGAFFWCWAEVNDFNRGFPACVDGNLCEGLVDQHRRPTMIFDAFCNSIKKIGEKENEADFWYNVKNSKAFLGENLLLSENSEEYNKIFAKYAQYEKSMPIPRFRVLRKGPVLKNIASLRNEPIVINDDKEIRLYCDTVAESLCLVGLVSFGKGYPLSGEYGEAVAKLTIQFEDGNFQEYVLKNGIEVTTVFTTNDSSRINPIAQKADRFALFGYDKNFESYVLNSIDIRVENDLKIKEISIKSQNNGYNLLLYALTVK